MRATPMAKFSPPSYTIDDQASCTKGPTAEENQTYRTFDLYCRGPATWMNTCWYVLRRFKVKFIVCCSFSSRAVPRLRDTFTSACKQTCVNQNETTYVQ